MITQAPPVRRVAPAGASRRPLAGAGRLAARRSLWTRTMQLLTLMTAAALTLSQTHALSRDSMTSVLRWVMLGLMSGMILIAPTGLAKLRRPKLFDGIFAAFAAFAFASMLYSAAPSTTVQRALSITLLYITVFWSLWLLADLRGGDRLATILLAVAGAVFVAGIFSIFLTDDAWLRARYRGILENPNAVGMLTVLFLPVAVARFIRHRDLSSMMLITLMVASVALSGSRNGVMTACLGLVFLMTRIRAWKSGLLFGAIFAIVFLAMPDGAAPTGRAVTPLSRLVAVDKVATGGGRIEAWQVAIPIIRKNLYAGHGFGTEDLIFRNTTFRIHRGLYVHNSYLGLTYQLGVVGSLLFFLPLFALLTVSVFRRNRPPAKIAAYEAVLFGGLVTCFFESWIYSAGNAFAFPFWIFVMLLARHVAGLGDQQPSIALSSRRPVSRPVFLRPAMVPRVARPPRFDPPLPRGSD